MIGKYCTDFRDRITFCIFTLLIFYFKHSNAINSNLYHYFCNCNITLCTPEDAEIAVDRTASQISYNEAGESEKYNASCRISGGNCVCRREYFQFGSKLAGCDCKTGADSKHYWDFLSTRYNTEAYGKNIFLDKCDGNKCWKEIIHYGTSQAGCKPACFKEGAICPSCSRKAPGDCLYLYRYLCRCNKTLCVRQDVERLLTLIKEDRVCDEEQGLEYDSHCKNFDGRCKCTREYIRAGSREAGCQCPEGEVNTYWDFLNTQDKSTEAYSNSLYEDICDKYGRCGKEAIPYGTTQAGCEQPCIKFRRRRSKRHHG